VGGRAELGRNLLPLFSCARRALGCHSGLISRLCVGPARLRGVVFYPGGSAVWPQCWMCAVCAVGRVGCCVGGGYPMGVSISSSCALFRPGGSGSATLNAVPVVRWRGAVPAAVCRWGLCPRCVLVWGGVSRGMYISSRGAYSLCTNSADCLKSPHDRPLARTTICGSSPMARLAKKGPVRYAPLHTSKKRARKGEG